MRAGGQYQRHDAVREASSRNPSGAGRFWPSAALLVDHYAKAWLSPRVSRWAKIGSVTVGQSIVIWL